MRQGGAKWGSCPDGFYTQFCADPHERSVISDVKFRALDPASAEIWSCRYSTESLIRSRPHLNKRLAEAGLIEAAVTRQAAFIAGRQLAGLALSRHDVREPWLGRDKNGLPQWPQPWCGSLSHSNDRAVVLISQTAVRLGIDVQQIVNARGRDAILRRTMSGPEQGWLKALRNDQQFLAATLVFSAKETLYKALFPEVQRYFGFDAAEVIAPSMEENRLQLRLKLDLTPSLRRDMVFPIHYMLLPGYVLTYSV